MPLVLARIRLVTDRGYVTADGEGYGASHALRLAANAVERQNSFSHFATQYSGLVRRNPVDLAVGVLQHAHRCLLLGTSVQQYVATQER